MNLGAMGTGGDEPLVCSDNSGARSSNVPQNWEVTERLTSDCRLIQHSGSEPIDAISRKHQQNALERSTRWAMPGWLMNRANHRHRWLPGTASLPQVKGTLLQVRAAILRPSNYIQAWDGPQGEARGIKVP